MDAEEAADRWLREVYRPTQARIAAFVGPDRDLVQAYCDVLEHKWLPVRGCRPRRGAGHRGRVLRGGGGARPGAAGRSGDAVLEALDVESDDPEYDGAAS